MRVSKEIYTVIGKIVAFHLGKILPGTIGLPMPRHMERYITFGIKHQFVAISGEWQRRKVVRNVICKHVIGKHRSRVTVHGHLPRVCETHLPQLAVGYLVHPRPSHLYSDPLPARKHRFFRIPPCTQCRKYFHRHQNKKCRQHNPKRYQS